MKTRAHVLLPASAWSAAIVWPVSPGFAQTMAPPQSTMPAPEGMPSRAAPQGMMGGHHPMMFDRVEGWIAFLNTELKVTEAQTAQWERFADSLRSSASSMNGMHHR